VKLKNLFRENDLTDIVGDIDIDIEGICCDSRICYPGCVFFAVIGYSQDGHDYIKNAMDKGAIAVVRSEKAAEIDGITYINVKDTRTALSYASSIYYHEPSHKIKVIGVTGTNGKTSTSYYLRSILEYAGKKVGIIGTLGALYNDKNIHLENTTPESLKIHNLINDMVQSKTEYVIMEVSSHSLAMNRVDDVSFHGGIFTNLSRDHLDFHKNIDDYFNAKKKLFQFDLKNIVINIDDEYGIQLYEMLRKEGKNVVGFGKNSSGETRIKNIIRKDNFTEFELGDDQFTSNVWGEFNVYNLVSAIELAKNEGIEMEIIKNAAISLHQVPGRMEKLSLEGLKFNIMIDYAHTSDGLESVLKSLNNSIGDGKIVVVFGCGGDRDKGKRPQMGEVSGRLSDYTIITSDNPRWENPSDIIKDIEEGIKKTQGKYEIIEDRYKAIKKGMTLIGEEDILLIAGKGHEKFQSIKGEKIPFDEYVIVNELAKELFRP